MLRSMYHIMLAGLCPLVWRGSWPRGFCYIFCPPHHPWAQSGPPAEWKPSPEDLTNGTIKPKPVKTVELPIPESLVASWSELKVLVANRPPAEALEHWWAPWAETDSCRDVLRALAARVLRLEIVDDVLRIHATDKYKRRPLFIEASSPFAGELKPMSRSAANLVRRHRGVDIIEAHGRRAIVPSFTKGRFPVEFDLWWTPDLWNPSEPFRKPPLAPCTDGQDIWVYHPLRLRQPGELELRRISHDGGDLCAALPYGAGGVVLRLIAEVVVPETKDTRFDFDLRVDSEETKHEA